MSVVSFSSSINRLSQVVNTYSDKTSRTIIHQGKNPSLGVLNNIIAAKAAYDPVDMNVGQVERLLTAGLNGLMQIASDLSSLREVAFQATDAQTTSSDRLSASISAGTLVANIDTTANETAYHGINLLDGSFTAKTYQTGTDKLHYESVADNTQLGDYQDSNVVKIAFASATANELGLDTLDLSSIASAQTAVQTIDEAASQITQMIAEKGKMLKVNRSDGYQSDKRKTLLFEARTLAPSIDFVTHSKTAFQFQLRQPLTLPYLNSGANLRQSTISIRI